MAMRSAAAGITRSSIHRVMDGHGVTPKTSSLFIRYSSDGRVLSEEERAKETVYIQKMERERLEKQKQKAEKEKAQKEKEAAEKKPEGDSH